ncbi:hypothetical protein ABBQ38_002420 [Trebouxia sp. C0009 RCD-2024]
MFAFNDRQPGTTGFGLLQLSQRPVNTFAYGAQQTQVEAGNSLLQTCPAWGAAQPRQRQMTDLLAKKLIEPSTIPYGAQVLHVEKRTADYKMVAVYFLP